MSAFSYRTSVACRFFNANYYRENKGTKIACNNKRNNGGFGETLFRINFPVHGLCSNNLTKTKIKKTKFENIISPMSSKTPRSYLSSNN